LAVDGVWLSDIRHRIRDLEQAYDFSTGELTSRFAFAPSGSTIRCEVLTFASREDPTVVCQELSITPDRACDLTVRAIVDATHIPGRALRYMRDTPGEPEATCDGTLLWESAGGLGVVGLAYVSQMSGGAAGAAEPKRPPLADNRLVTSFAFRARAGQRYRLKQMTSLVCGVMHHQPDQHAARMAAKPAWMGSIPSARRTAPFGESSGRAASAWWAPARSGKRWPTRRSSTSTAQCMARRRRRLPSSAWPPGTTITTTTAT
jgi:hypothetical protein